MTLYFQILSGCGFVVSLYALAVRHKVLRAPSYSPICDIRENISCSKAFGSKYSQTFGIPNPLAGMLFYLVIFGLSFSYKHLVVYPAAGSVLFSLYLAYISYIKQKNFCLVCTFTYLLNIAILIIALTW